MFMTPYTSPASNPVWNDAVDFYNPYGSTAAVWPSTRTDMSLYPAMKRTRETLSEFSPIMSADIIEGEHDFHVHVDLPGVHMDDLDITVANGRLNITAERRQVHKTNAFHVHKVERSFGKVQRSIPIPAGAMEDTADAKFEGGVLTVRLLKKADVMHGRKLTIKND